MNATIGKFREAADSYFCEGGEKKMASLLERLEAKEEEKRVVEEAKVLVESYALDIVAAAATTESKAEVERIANEITALNPLVAGEMLLAIHETGDLNVANKNFMRAVDMLDTYTSCTLFYEVRITGNVESLGQVGALQQQALSFFNSLDTESSSEWFNSIGVTGNTRDLLNENVINNEMLDLVNNNPKLASELSYLIGESGRPELFTNNNFIEGMKQMGAETAAEYVSAAWCTRNFERFSDRETIQKVVSGGADIWNDVAREESGGRASVVMAKPAGDQHDRGAKLAVQSLMGKGYDVIYIGGADKSQIVSAALRHGADAIGFSMGGDADRNVVFETMNALKQNGAGNVAIFGGGFVSEDTARMLQNNGMKLFGYGTTQQEVLNFIGSVTNRTHEVKVSGLSGFQATVPGNIQMQMTNTSHSSDILDARRHGHSQLSSSFRSFEWNPGSIVGSDAVAMHYLYDKARSHEEALSSSVSHQNPPVYIVTMNRKMQPVPHQTANLGMTPTSKGFKYEATPPIMHAAVVEPIRKQQKETAAEKKEDILHSAKAVNQRPITEIPGTEAANPKTKNQARTPELDAHHAPIAIQVKQKVTDQEIAVEKIRAKGLTISMTPEIVSALQGRGSLQLLTPNVSVSIFAYVKSSKEVSRSVATANVHGKTDEKDMREALGMAEQKRHIPFKVPLAPTKQRTSERMTVAEENAIGTEPERRVTVPKPQAKRMINEDSTQQDDLIQHVEILHLRRPAPASGSIQKSQATARPDPSPKPAVELPKTQVPADKAQKQQENEQERGPQPSVQVSGNARRLENRRGSVSSIFSFFISMLFGR